MKKNEKKLSWFSVIKEKFFRPKDDRAQLLQHLHDAQRKGIINLDALMMIEGVFQVSEMQVRDICWP